MPAVRAEHVLYFPPIALELVKLSNDVVPFPVPLVEAGFTERTHR